MPNSVEDLLPFAVPVVIGLFTAAITSAMLTPKRLRREIADETQLLGDLRGVPRGLLAADIADKTVRLSAWNRYPAITSQDLVRLGAILFFVVVATVGAVDLGRNQPEEFYYDLHLWPILIYVGLVGSQWYALYGNLIWRRHDRTAFYKAYGTRFDEDDRDFHEVTGSMALAVFGVVTVVGPPFVQATLLFKALDVADKWTGWLALGMTAASGLVMWSSTQAEKRRPVSTRRAMRMDSAEAERRRAEKRARKAESQRAGGSASEAEANAESAP